MHYQHRLDTCPFDTFHLALSENWLQWGGVKVMVGLMVEVILIYSDFASKMGP